MEIIEFGDDQWLEDDLYIRKVLKDSLFGFVGNPFIFRFIMSRGTLMLTTIRAC